MSLWAEIHTYGQETPIVRNDNPLISNNMGSDFYSNWYFDTQPEPYDFQEPYEPEPDQYDLQPRMLDNEYDFIGFSAETNIKKETPPFYNFCFLPFFIIFFFIIFIYNITKFHYRYLDFLH